MMKEFVRKNKVAVIVGSIFVMTCILLSAVHVNYVKNFTKDKLQRTLNHSVQMAGKMMEEKMYTFESLANQGSMELGQLEVTSNGNIYRILSAYQNSKQFDRVFYLKKDGKMYLGSKQTVKATDMKAVEALAELDYGNEAITLSNTGLMDDYGLTVVAPVMREDTITGYFIGQRKTDELLSMADADFMKIKPAYFMIDEPGDIVVEDTRFWEDGEFSNIANLMLNLEELDTIKEDMMAFRSRMYEQKSGNTDLRISKSKEGYLAVYTPVKSEENWMLVCLVPFDQVDAFVLRNTFDEIVTIVVLNIIILLLFILSFGYLYQREQKMEREAYMDGLTGVRNMTFFRKEAQRLLTSEKRPVYSVVSIDIINFRYVNEVFGHERGDEVLRTLASYLQEGLGTKELVARYTADLFFMLLVDFDNIDKKIESISTMLNDYARSIDVSFPLFLRAGYYRVGKADYEIKEMEDKANTARKTITPESSAISVKYTIDMQKNVKEREEIESAMESALEHEEFKVFLQPKIDVNTGKVAGAETLVRWIKRDGNMVYPDHFIPVFEQNGFVEKLDFYMLETVCQKLAQWRAQGKKLVPISVNQSRVLLMNPNYVNRVKDILQKYDIPKGMIELELTETIFFDDKNKMIRVMNELHENDIVIDIDDFGSGYSSLNMLKDIPFDILKIDREFFGESKNGKGRLILQKVVEMARCMGVQCICEGVENEEQENLLREIGCQYAQGYLYAKPMPAEDFYEEYIKQA